MCLFFCSAESASFLIDRGQFGRNEGRYTKCTGRESLARGQGSSVYDVGIALFVDLEHSLMFFSATVLRKV